jgi:hypothetical protein
MSTINDGGPAFPAGAVRKSRPAHDPGADFRVTDVVQPSQAGMTLRDYFAAKALPGLMGRNWSAHTGTDEELIEIWARSSYGVADAMLRAREAT